jgi:broad specificity phosphatase PhoE
MKPDRIFLVRHGQSVGNADKSIYKDIPDYALHLTALGHEQAKGAGMEIRKIIPKYSNIQFYISPFWRTRQTYADIRKALPETDYSFKFYEDPRLREQEWGQNMGSREGYSSKIEEYRDSYGHFYYRFRDGGESCADVFDRMSDFMNTLFRDFKKKDFPRNVVIVTHGMTMRLFIMRWFHCSVEEFESWGNPPNGAFYLLERRDNEKYNLVTPLRTHKLRHPFQFQISEDQKDFFPIQHELPYETQRGQSTNYP